MKSFNLAPATLAKYWAAEVNFEMSSPLWPGALTIGQSRSLEKIQHLALSTITTSAPDHGLPRPVKHAGPGAAGHQEDQAIYEAVLG